MPKPAYRYNFKSDADFSEALITFDLAVIATEAIYGEARVRLEVRFVDNRQKRRIAIMADTEVAKAANLFFTKFALVEFGNDSFTIDQIYRHDSSGDIEVSNEYDSMGDAVRDEGSK